MGPGGPKVATEWIVEARSGGTCVVRVVHSWFASTDDWDNQFEGHMHGWAAFFRILRLYLAHFRGQPCAAFQLMGAGAEPKAATWGALVGPLRRRSCGAGGGRRGARSPEPRAGAGPGGEARAPRLATARGRPLRPCAQPPMRCRA
ncbi:hypothetical protein WMF27_11640 [Sorangium sp. So ce281]|uniref:hypothetical protein n=1 Tax=unclassified Sorangium TaxID=2621164 RepID=UPI003F607D18